MNRLSVISAAQTDTGIVRDHNEDAVLEHPRAGLWAVADGMGGHSAGDVASTMVIQALSELAAESSLADMANRVDDAMQQVNRELRALALRRGTHTIGTTVAVLVAHQRHALAMWAGDSRIYRLRDGRLDQLSHDHALVSELLAHGVITQDQAETHPHGNLVTRAVGASDELHLDLEIVELAPGDLFLLCTDGLDKEVADGEIAAAAAGQEVADIPPRLVELALTRGGRDNVSVVVAQVEADGDGNRSVTHSVGFTDSGEDTLPDFSLNTDAR